MAPQLSTMDSIIGEKMALPPASTVLSFHKPSFVHEDSRFSQYFTLFAKGINSIVSLLNAKMGPTATRPHIPYIGQLYFDTTLAVDGKPTWWTGLTWVDFSGTIIP